MKTLTAKQNRLGMPGRSSRLIRHNASQTPRVGVLTGPLGALDQFPTHEIGFRLSLSAFQELEKQRLLRDVLRHSYIRRDNRNQLDFQVRLKKSGITTRVAAGVCRPENQVEREVRCPPSSLHPGPPPQEKSLGVDHRPHTPPTSWLLCEAVPPYGPLKHLTRQRRSQIGRMGRPHYLGTWRCPNGFS